MVHSPVLAVFVFNQAERALPEKNGYRLIFMRTFQKNRSNSFFALLSLPSTAMGFALSIQISALSWILTTQYKLDIHDVGLVWAAGPLAGILGQVIIGVVSDKVWFWNGRRRPFILIGGVLAALSLLALPNLHVISAGLGAGGGRQSVLFAAAGADVLVAGSALFRDPEGLEHAVSEIRALAESARA